MFPLHLLCTFLRGHDNVQIFEFQIDLVRWQQRGHRPLAGCRGGCHWEDGARCAWTRHETAAQTALRVTCVAEKSKVNNERNRCTAVPPRSTSPLGGPVHPAPGDSLEGGCPLSGRNPATHRDGSGGLLICRHHKRGASCPRQQRVCTMGAGEWSCRNLFFECRSIG